MKKILLGTVFAVAVILFLAWYWSPIFQVGTGGGTLYINKRALGDFKIGMKDSHILTWFPDFDYAESYFDFVRGGISTHGGWGAVLYIESKKYGVEFIWQYRELCKIRLSKGWHGQTDCGLCMGDTIERLLQLYPSAERSVSEWPRWVNEEFGKDDEIIYSLPNCILCFDDNKLVSICLQ